MMSEDEFNDLIVNLPFQDYLVTIASKYTEKEEWTIHNEILQAEIMGYADGPQYVWLDDWYEGQPFVRIVGFNSIQSIALYDMKKQENAEELSKQMEHSKQYYHHLIREELKCES